MTIQRKALPKGANRQQGALLNSARTLDGYVGLRENPLPGGSSGSESVSSPPVSDADRGLHNLAPAKQGKIQPTRRSAQKDDGYYEEQATMDTSDVDEPSPAFTMADFVINDFVVFDVNGQCFPGKILKVDKRKRRFLMATMKKFNDQVSASWQMPDKPTEHTIELDAIKEKIKRPVGKKYLDKEVFIEQMSTYGW